MVRVTDIKDLTKRWECSEHFALHLLKNAKRCPRCERIALVTFSQSGEADIYTCCFCDYTIE